MNTANKSDLRTRCKTRRASLDAVFRAACSSRVKALFLANVPVKDKIVAGYSPIGDELDVLPLMQALYAQDIPCALPVTVPPEKRLIFRRWTGESDMIKDRYGISAPAEHKEALTPGIIIVPLLGFDAALHRIGYGAGYYDRTLQTLRSSGNPLLTIGVGFGVQKIEDSIAEPHDEPLDMIITENGIIRKEK
jgi:5-formyltetrahydrofolate cyclo-ligase